MLRRGNFYGHFKYCIANITSDDFNPPFRACLVLPPKEETREPERVERTENLKVYMQQEPKTETPMPAPVPRKEVPKFSQAEYQLPESRFSTRAEPRQVTEPTREQIMSPEPLRESPVDPRFPMRTKSVREMPTESRFPPPPSVEPAREILTDSRFQPPPPAEPAREILAESRFQPPTPAEPVREIPIESRFQPPQDNPVREILADTRFVQRLETRQAEEPTREQVMSPDPVKEKPRESRFLRYPEPRVVDGPRAVEQPVREERKPIERDSSQESRRSARSSRNGSRVLEELMREESKPVTREYSRESFRSEPRISPKGSVREMEEIVREDVKTAPRLYSNNPFHQQSNIQASTRVAVREVEESHQKEMKTATRSSPSPLSQEINYPVQEARIAARNLITQLPSPTNTNYSYQESTVSSRVSPLPSPREAPTHEARMPARIIAKISEEPLREEVKSVSQPAKEEVKPLTERKLNRTPSFPKIPKDDIKAPIMKELQTTPRVASIEEMIEDTKLPPTSAPAKHEVKPPTETKETTKEASTTKTTEGEEMWTPQPAFKMRKSKKRFSTRF
ncbi:hypothetical protein BGZ60DRAFT_101935 [Tricladium varicosporioides]|nr:hypothetical protein BGZ60DRAFT_101935 [Hymenoscyphus varicosporioides]